MRGAPGAGAKEPILTAEGVAAAHLDGIASRRLAPQANVRTLRADRQTEFRRRPRLTGSRGGEAEPSLRADRSRLVLVRQPRSHAARRVATAENELRCMP